MGTSLTGLEIKDTYDGLVKTTDNGPISGTAKFLSDGLGNDSALALSTTAVGINGLFPALSTIKLLVGSQLSNEANLALQLFKAGTPQILSGDVLGNILFAGIDNDITTGVNNIGAKISAVATTNWTTDGTTSNTALTFHTHGTALGDAPERMRIDSVGNVGIGTSGATKKLEVQVAGGDAIRISNSTNSAYFSDLQLNFNDGTTMILSCMGTAIVTSGNTGDTILASRTANTIFKTSGTERGRFTADGLTFNGDTAAANALDDYEEGTFTPTFSGATFTHQIQTGFYTKIGRQVSIFIDVEATYTSATGTFACTLPFSVLANSRGEGVVRPITGVTFTNYVTCEAVGSSIFFENCNSSTGQASTDMNSTNFNAAGFRLFASVTYFV